MDEETPPTDPAGEENDNGPFPPADQPRPEDLVVPDTRASDPIRARIVLAAAVVIVLSAAGWLVFGRSEEVVAPTSTTTTTTTTEPAAMTWPAQEAQVATARPDVSAITVLASAPEGWETAKPVSRWEAPALPASQDSMEARPALPRVDYPVEGRKATETGWEFDNPTVFDNPLSFLVTEMRGDWAKVVLPVRPNHTEGWVSLNDVTLGEHDYRVELRLAEHRLTVYRGDEMLADTPVVVGKEATHTPTGRFFVTDKLERDPDGFYGPFILALNGYSEQLDIFDDGVPVIAMHGTNQPQKLGTSASNGCIRMPNEVITQLNAELPLGTPVEIYA